MHLLFQSLPRHISAGWDRRYGGAGWNSGDLARWEQRVGAICKALDCQPGDILEYVPDEEG